MTLPAKRINKQNGQDSSVVDFLEIHFNPQVDAKLFDKPTDTSSH